jgi:sugar lactone lactonase YvrE
MYVFDQPEVAIRADAETGEGPVFDRRTGHLVWVDIPHGSLLETDLVIGQTASTSLGTSLGAAVPRAGEQGFAVAVADGFGIVADGLLDVVDRALPEADRRMNDAKCDSAGRLWAGSTHVAYEAGAGALHCWTGTEPSRVVATGLTLPNGIGWTADDTQMYLVDSMNHHLLRASFDAATGETGEFTEFARIETGLPDGLAVDVEGCIWVAVWGGAAVLRFDPDGRLIARVPMPVDQPSSCAFGDDGTLYITSAWAGLDDSARARQPLAGSVFALDSGTRGVPVSAFAH